LSQNHIHKLNTTNYDVITFVVAAYANVSDTPLQKPKSSPTHFKHFLIVIRDLCFY